LRPDTEKQTGQNKDRQPPPPTIPRPPKLAAFRTCSASSLLQGPPAVTRSWKANARERKPTKLTGL
jgi:hypothetical protein